MIEIVLIPNVLTAYSTTAEVFDNMFEQFTVDIVDYNRSYSNLWHIQKYYKNVTLILTVRKKITVLFNESMDYHAKNAV